MLILSILRWKNCTRAEALVHFFPRENRTNKHSSKTCFITWMFTRTITITPIYNERHAAHNTNPTHYMYTSLQNTGWCHHIMVNGHPNTPMRARYGVYFVNIASDAYLGVKKNMSILQISCLNSTNSNVWGSKMICVIKLFISSKMNSVWQVQSHLSREICDILRLLPQIPVHAKLWVIIKTIFQVTFCIWYLLCATCIFSTNVTLWAECGDIW